MTLKWLLERHLVIGASVISNRLKPTLKIFFYIAMPLIFQNTQQYYEENAVEYKAGLRLSKYFLKTVRSSQLHSAGLVENENEPPSKKKRKS